MYRYLYDHEPAYIEKRLVGFIIQRFLFHACNALIYGYPLTVLRVMRISLVHCLNSFLPRYYRKRIKYSQRAFGYSFFLVASSARMTRENYVFRMNEEMKRRIEEMIDTDVVYKLARR